MKPSIDHLRAQILAIGIETKALHQHRDFGAPVPGADPGEMHANITLAYRHLEDARMRLGKVLQAQDGGVSAFDKPTLVFESTPRPIRCKSYAELAVAFNSGALSRDHYVLVLDKGGTENHLAYRGPIENDEHCDRMHDEACAIFRSNDGSIEGMLEALGIPHEWC